MNWLVRLLRRFAEEYREGHLYHWDGSFYMERYGLFETRWLSARLHRIATPDFDRDMHDHPWPFVSVLLQGAYVEERPTFPTRVDCENARSVNLREAPSIAFRWHTDRHVISAVAGDVWSLFIYGPKLQWWGFITKDGKVPWRKYESVHANGRIVVEKNQQVVSASACRECGQLGPCLATCSSKCSVCHHSAHLADCPNA